MVKIEKIVHKSYEIAKDYYARYGVDTEKAIRRLKKIPISLHCWQGDDNTGFEQIESRYGGGIQATGDYPGKARNPDELRNDLDMAYRLIPGRHRLNLHAFYAETHGQKVDRDKLRPEHFSDWIDWAKDHQRGLDFNGTFFAHPKADRGFTLSSYDKGIRRFWIDHAIACRKIGETMGRKLGSPCVTNLWIPDGYKDIPADRLTPRKNLTNALDEIFAQRINPKYNLDAVESKLFGIGSESYVVGSHEFYLGYAAKNRKLLCLDAGHFHPTETLADKISSCLLYVDELLLHVSRGIRWDSDHVVILCDDLKAIAQELVRGEFLTRVHIGLDFFDASINRIAAWVLGTRAMLKALLLALLEPSAMLNNYECNGDYTARLTLMEEIKTLPVGAVWDYYCLMQSVPVGIDWFEDVKAYEKKILANRQ